MNISVKDFCQNICNEINTNFHFSRYKSMASCHSNQSSYPIGTKKQQYSFPLPIDAICEYKNRPHGFRGDIV